jgi:hypothetical protein
MTIGVIMLITCAFISIILCNLWSGAVATALITINLIQLIGFMSIYDIRLNAMSIIAILISIVIDFDFIIHFLYTFRTLIGIDNQRRMISTIEQMLVPIIQGSFAMILSILALAFNQFDFVIKLVFIENNYLHKFIYLFIKINDGYYCLDISLFSLLYRLSLHYSIVSHCNLC